MLADTCPPSSESTFRFLYLGNDLKLIATLRGALREPVYRVVVCSDHDSAVRFLKSEIPYDLLLLDLAWRGKEGVEVAELTHSLKHRKRMPIVLLADTELDRQAFILDKEVAATAGVQECVLKTQDVAELIKQMMPET